MNKLSIITINYNNRDGLLKTIESVIGQTYTDYEYIIIDGGSTDGSVEMVKQYAEKIDIWVSEPDKGIYNAMNKGILKSTGEYCNFMNSGDCYSDKEVLANILPLYDEDIILGSYHEEGSMYRFAHHSNTITMLDLFRKGINHQSTFIKRKLFNENLYDESLRIVADWKFFVDVLVFRNCTFRNVDTVVTMYDTTGISSTNKEALLSERTRVLKDMLPERIYSDYTRYAKSDSPLLEFTPFLNQTYGFQSFIYKIVALLIRIYTFRQNFFFKNKTR
ncbi:MAG TPA: glycosyltransferase family 2 protein [Ruminiclostridium sp.]